jgi:hypothetical protein
MDVNNPSLAYNKSRLLYHAKMHVQFFNNNIDFQVLLVKHTTWTIQMIEVTSSLYNYPQVNGDDNRQQFEYYDKVIIWWYALLKSGIFLQDITSNIHKINVIILWRTYAQQRTGMHPVSSTQKIALDIAKNTM